MYATAIVWYLKAIDRRNRPEPYYYLSQCLRHVGAYRVAERLLAYCDATYSDDQLFTAQWIEEWGIEFERAISLQRLGQYTSAREIYYRLMDRGDLPDEFRRVAVRNVTLMTDAVVN